MKSTISNFIKLVFVSIIVFSTSCKKTDDNIIHEPDEYSFIYPDAHVLSFHTMDILTDIEKENDLMLHSHFLGTHFSTLDGVESDVFTIPAWKWKDLDPVYDIHGAMKEYSKVTSDIDQIKNSISKAKAEIEKISQKISQLENDIKELALELKIDIDELEADIELKALEDIYIQLDVLLNTIAPEVGLYYYFKHADSIAKLEISNVLKREKMAVLREQFEKEYATGFSETTVTGYISTIESNLSSSTTGLSNNLLQKLLDIYILKNPVTNPNTALTGYAFVEKIMVKAMHNQLMGLMLIGNHMNFKHPNGSVFKEFKKSTFNPKVTANIQLLKDAAYHIVINSININNENYVSDMQNIYYGISPYDPLFNVLARANFTSSLMQCDGDSLSNFIAGTIYIPYYYANKMKAPSSSKFSYSLDDPYNNETFDSRNNTVFKSRLPYTAWRTSGSSIEAYPDNQWVFYQTAIQKNPKDKADDGYYGKISTPSGSEPWPNYTDPNSGINFEVDIKYWNPTNPDIPSATPDETHTMPFAFFSMRWIWGYHAMSQGDFDKEVAFVETDDPNFNKLIANNNSKNPYIDGIEIKETTRVTYPNSKNPEMASQIELVQPDEKAESDATQIWISSQYTSSVKFANNSTQATQNPPVSIYITGEYTRTGTWSNEEGTFTSNDNAFIRFTDNNSINYTYNYEIQESVEAGNSYDTTFADTTGISPWSSSNPLSFYSAAGHWESLGEQSFTKGLNNHSVYFHFTAQPIFHTSFDISGK